ncbi:MAG: segregation and condensation protein A [Fimbriimonas sp.]
MAPRHELAERNDRISALGVIAPPPIHVQTPTFDGSLAALFACVRDHKVDLLQIPLFPICEAYFTYLLQAADTDLDEAAAALSALAYLLERKAWLLLPVPDPEPEFDEPMELPDPSIHEFASAMRAMALWQEERDQLFFRSPDAGPDPYELPYTLGNVGVGDLTLALERLLKRATPEAFETLAKPRRSLKEQMEVVLGSMGEEWRTLDILVPEPFTRVEAVYWFLALLELIRLGQVQARITEEDVEFARAA